MSRNYKFSGWFFSNYLKLRAYKIDLVIFSNKKLWQNLGEFILGQSALKYEAIVDYLYIYDIYTYLRGCISKLQPFEVWPFSAKYWL